MIRILILLSGIFNY